jgi:YD repeat-containing protein
VGITFNLSKQVSTELDKLQLELELEGDIRPSKSEITEVALRIAVEDVRGRGRESELVKRLRERRAARATGATDEGGLTAWRSVDEAGFIVETTYDENGKIVDENVVASVAELLVEAEYLDEKGRLVSLARDELGNTFEQIMDEEFNTLGTRLLLGAD